VEQAQPNLQNAKGHKIDPTPTFKMFHISAAAGQKNGQFNQKKTIFL
jgi:hypothetical protein